MGIKVVAGPAGAGKSDAIERAVDELDVVIDFTLLHRALFPHLRDEVRDDRLAATLLLTQWVKQAALRHAVERDMSGYVTTTRPEQIDTLLAAVGGNRGTDLIIVDPGRREVLRRLAESQPGREQECVRAVDRWYAAI